jgi:hypothetical protein
MVWSGFAGKEGGEMTEDGYNDTDRSADALIESALEIERQEKQWRQEEMEEAIQRADAVLEMSMVGAPIAYDGSLGICDLSSQCKCASCVRVFSPSNCRGAERVSEW